MKYINKYEKIFVEAHRGASGYEYMNTIPAFDKAVELKANAIELDIRKTQDDKIIVVHDAEYHGKTINNWRYDELCQETLKDNFIMPLFIDVLNRYKGKILIDIETKEIGYEKEIVDIILSVLSIDEFYIRSFNESSLKLIKEYNKDIYTILLLGTGEKHKGWIFYRLLELFPSLKIKQSLCDAVSPYYKILILGFVSRMHMKNLPVYAWTVNEDKVIDKVIKKKVDGIVTNYPDKVLNKIN